MTGMARSNDYLSSGFPNGFERGVTDPPSPTSAQRSSRANRRRKPSARLSAIAVAVLVGLGLTGLAPALASADEPAFTGTVSIVHVNDVHANAFAGEPGIGYGKIAAYADQQRAANPNTLFVDAGDVFAGTPWAAFDNGQSLIPVLNSLGLDVMTAGNAEFTYGSQQYLHLVDQLDYPVLVGNMVYRDGGAPIGATTTTMVLPNGMTMGFVGVTTPLSAAMGAMDLEYIDAIEVAREGIAQLRAQNVDLLVGLVHLGELDTVMSSIDLANEIEDFDVIIDGHSHTLFPEGFVQNGTLVVQAGSFANNFGQVDLEIVDGAVVGVSERVFGTADVAELEPKAETEALLQQLRASAEESLASVVGSTSVQLDGNRTKVRTGEAEVANLFTDAIREAAESDFVILGAGFIGGNVPPGPITRKQVFDIARVDTGILVKRMSGAAILQYLEGVTRDFPAESGTFPHVSGGSYRLDVEGTPRIHSVVIEDAPLDPTAFYEVAIPYGGNSLPGAAGAELLRDLGSATPMLEDYISAHSPVAPVLEGRFAQATTPEPEPEETTPSPVPDEQLTDADRGDVRVPDEVVQGGRITVSAPGHGGEQVRVWLHSAPVLLATVILDASGSAVVTIPSDAALGDHRVVVQALDGTLIGWDGIRVVAASQGGAGGTGGAELAATGSGSEPMLFAAGAMLLLLAGGVVLAVRRSHGQCSDA